MTMMRRETESNDDAPGGRGTQRNDTTIEHSTRKRTDEHDKRNERATVCLLFSLVRPSLSLRLVFSFLLPSLLPP